MQIDGISFKAGSIFFSRFPYAAFCGINAFTVFSEPSADFFHSLRLVFGNTAVRLAADTQKIVAVTACAVNELGEYLFYTFDFASQYLPIPLH